MVAATGDESVGDAGVGETEPPLDPRYAAAFDAIEAGDWAGAEAAYRAVLNGSPADEDARAGVALAQLMQRVEAAMRSDVDSASIEGRLAAADAAAASGEMAAAFALLVDVVRDTAGDERESARQRLLDLFLVAGDDPAVPPARLALANALF
jgi:putative thioredoxin